MSHSKVPCKYFENLTITIARYTWNIFVLGLPTCIKLFRILPTLPSIACNGIAGLDHFKIISGHMDLTACIKYSWYFRDSSKYSMQWYRLL